MAKPRKRLADIITRHQVFLERFNTHEARNLSAVFKDFDKRTREILDALDTPNIGELSKKKLNALKATARPCLAKRKPFRKK